MSIEKKLENLYGILDQEISIYDHLFEIISKEKELLIAAQVELLNENNNSKEAMILKLHDLEQARANATRSLALEVGLAENGVKISDLSARLAEGARHQLLQRRDVLVMSIERVSLLNKGNEALAEAALATVTGAMGNIRDSLKPNPTYKREGGMKPNTLASGQLVSREA